VATEGQQKMLWVIAKNSGFALPGWEMTEHLSQQEVAQIKTRLEAGEDVFATWPVPDEKSRPEFEPADIALLGEILRELRAIREILNTRGE
jgi:hypothetical protein